MNLYIRETLGFHNDVLDILARTRGNEWKVMRGTEETSETGQFYQRRETLETFPVGDLGLNVKTLKYDSWKTHRDLLQMVLEIV